MAKVVTGSRVIIADVKRMKPNDDIDFNPAMSEIDNHADTHVFGKNFRPIYFTSEVCSVAPFMDEYKEQENVRICTGATAYETKFGETIILQFGQGLWFGNRMEKSLINPNQCRAYGIPICDDPMDPHRELGMNIDDDLFIPLVMNGSTCGLTTRCPTDDELHTCRIFTLSNEQHWDPTDVTYHRIVASVGRGENCHSSVCNDKVRCEYPDKIYDYEYAFRAVQVNATYTATRHHGNDPILLSRKWGIGLKRAKDTIKNTTQLNIRSAILPLTRRYKTDLLSQRFRRLSTRFYTDTALCNVKSVVGNTCAQIFTDGEGFVVAYPMKAKSSAGEMLSRCCNDIGVPNELHMNNAPEMIGDDTQFREVCRTQRIRTTTIEPKSPGRINVKML